MCARHLLLLPRLEIPNRFAFIPQARNQNISSDKQQGAHQDRGGYDEKNDLQAKDARLASELRLYLLQPCMITF
jgi:hypothetical protein